LRENAPRYGENPGTDVAIPFTAELRAIARDVRRIGGGRSNPESILIDKETTADRLFDLARRMEARA